MAVPSAVSRMPLPTTAARLPRSAERSRLCRRSSLALHALEVSLKVLEKLAPVEVRIRRKSASLAKQLANASESVALNLGEGRSRRDGDQRRHYEMAAGSASEVTVALRIALAKQYVTAEDLAPVDELLDRVRAMLYRLTR